MNLQKTHFANVRKFRAARRKRREDYLRALEFKASNFATLYADTQKEIKMLREKLAFLEGRLVKAQRNFNNKFSNYNTSVYQIIEQNNDNSSDNVVMSHGMYHFFKLVISIYISILKHCILFK